MQLNRERNSKEDYHEDLIDIQREVTQIKEKFEKERKKVTELKEKNENMMETNNRLSEILEEET